MERIKILFLIDQMNIGGTEKQLVTVINRLDPAKFDLYLVCLRSTEYFEKCNIMCHKKVLNITSLASYGGLLMLFKFARFLRQEKIDIIQTFFFDSTVFGVLSARLARVKKILSSRRDMGFWYTPTILTVLFFINLLTHRIVVNSNAIKENIILREHVSAKKIDVFYNGIDLERFSTQYNDEKIRNKLGIPANNKVVGIVANLNRRVKRVDLFVDAAADVLQKQKNVSFIIVGDGKFRSELEEQAIKNGVSSQLCFVGSQNNIIPYLQLFDVGVLTSESEGFSNSIIEYMAVGLPVVCFDSGGNNEMVINEVSGFLIELLSFKDVAFKILELLDSPELIKKISAYNLNKSLEFDFNSTVSQYNSYYSQLARVDI